MMTVMMKMTRESRLEEALRAATKLRRAVEIPGKVPLARLLVPVEAIEEYDAVIERLKNDDAKSG